MEAKETKPVKAKAPRKPRKKKAEVRPTTQMTDHNVGIKKTQLMRLAEKYGDTGLTNPRSIDPLVHLLAELGEITFGSDVIVSCESSIALSNSGFPRGKAIGFLADQMVRKYLAHALIGCGKDELGLKISKMPVLNSASYVDYFMACSTLERDAFRTDVHKVANDMVKIVTGYQTEQAGQVCDAIVNFFKTTKNRRGFEELLKNLCHLVKTGKN